jgi:hypothetical protein
MREGRLCPSESRLFGPLCIEAALTVGVITMAFAARATRSASTQPPSCAPVATVQTPSGTACGIVVNAIATGHPRDR